VSARPTVVVHSDAAALAEAAAARLVVATVEAQNSRGWAHIVLTGGGVGMATLEALAALPGRDAIDWRRIDLWFGDERFLPSGDPDRNETQARHALLDQLDLDPARAPASTSGPTRPPGPPPARPRAGGGGKARPREESDLLQAG